MSTENGNTPDVVGDAPKTAAHRRARSAADMFVQPMTSGFQPLATRMLETFEDFLQSVPLGAVSDEDDVDDIVMMFAEWYSDRGVLNPPQLITIRLQVMKTVKLGATAQSFENMVIADTMRNAYARAEMNQQNGGGGPIGQQQEQRT